MECPACGYSLKEKFPLCNEHSVTYKRKTHIFSIYQCPECHSEFADPMKSAPPDWYSYMGEYYGWRWEFAEFLKDIKTLLHTGKVLEVGCGEGIVLNKLKRYDTIGLDFNNNAIEKAKAKGLKVYPMTVEEFSRQFPLIRFKAVAFFHVLEHIESPQDFLRNIKGFLDKDGLIFLSVPNPNRIRLVLSREDWDYPPHHLLRFSVNGLLKLLDRGGFKILKIKEQPKDLPLLHITSTVELDKFINRTMHIDVMRFGRLSRNVLRLPFFIPFNLVNFFTVMKTIIRHMGKSGTALYLVAQKEG